MTLDEFLSEPHGTRSREDRSDIGTFLRAVLVDVADGTMEERDDVKIYAHGSMVVTYRRNSSNLSATIENGARRVEAESTIEFSSRGLPSREISARLFDNDVPVAAYPDRFPSAIITRTFLDLIPYGRP